MRLKRNKGNYHKRNTKRVLAGALALVTAFTMAPQTGALSLLGNQSPRVLAASTVTTRNADTFSWDNANVYFLLTDRFQNGNPSNDHSYGRGLDQNGNVINYNDNGATFHGGDFKGITDKLEEGYFNDLGVNALWISAPYEQIHGYVIGSDGSESYAHYSYHGYYVLDYTQTDANFGTAEEFRKMVDTAHEHGIRVVLDVVMNHAGYNTLADMSEYGFGTLKSNWPNAYYRASGINNTTYHGAIDYESSASDWSKWWGPDWVRCGLPGYEQGGSTNQLMNLSGLPDFKTESAKTVSIPEFLKTKWTREGRYNEEYSKLTSYLSSHNMNMTVTNCITYWLQSWVREYGVDGFRCDTAKHVEVGSWNTLKQACKEALKDWKAKNPSKALDDEDFWMTGEVWDHGVYKDEYYTKGGFDSIINFSTQGAGILSKNRVAATYQGFADSINSDPDFNVLSYISSHDSVLARGNSIYNGSAFLLCPGGIQIYYGDESDRPLDTSAASNGQHDLRSNMNWDSMNEETLAHWQKVGTFRNNHIAVGAGQNSALTTSDGVAFSRTYSNSSKDIHDQIAACIGCSANTDVTINVSSLWSDGQYVVNAYDYSNAIVTNGTVTFNSGANGTILIEEPDGKPLTNVSGATEFTGTQKVTLSLTGAEYAKISVDGAKKFIAYDGDTFTIGATAYDGDVVKVQVEATNEYGTRTATFSFNKIEHTTIAPTVTPTEVPSPTPSITPTVVPSPTPTPIVVEDSIYVKSDFVPYVYAWKGSSTPLAGSWPGTKVTTKNAEGYYELDLNSTDVYNLVLNNGFGKQTKDITGLQGGTWIHLNNDMTYSIIKTGDVNVTTTPVVTTPSPSKTTPPVTGKNTFTFYVSSYTDKAPYLYIWDEEKTYSAGFPGTLLSEKEDGYYVMTVKSDSPSLNCIVSYGNSTTQSGNITGITGTVTIENDGADYKSCTVTKSVAVESNYKKLKSMTRSIKNMTPEDFTASTWSALYSYVAPADSIIALGEENANEDDINAMLANEVAAMANLQVAAPVVNQVMAGQTVMTGTAAYGSTITISVNGTTYTTIADDVTGVWSVKVNSVPLGSQVRVESTLGCYISNSTLIRV